jgi:hypothetical protein
MKILRTYSNTKGVKRLSQLCENRRTDLEAFFFYLLQYCDLLVLKPGHQYYFITLTPDIDVKPPEATPEITSEVKQQPLSQFSNMF